MARFIEGPLAISPREARYDEGRLALLTEHFSRRIDAGKLHDWTIAFNPAIVQDCSGPVIQ